MQQHRRLRYADSGMPTQPDWDSVSVGNLRTGRRSPRNISSLAWPTVCKVLAAALPINRAVNTGPVPSCKRIAWGILKKIRFNESVGDWFERGDGIRVASISGNEFIKTQNATETLSLKPIRVSKHCQGVLFLWVRINPNPISGSSVLQIIS